MSNDIGPSDNFEKRVFPVYSDTSCLLKWAWSTVFLRQGTSSSCHRTDQAPIPADNFASFHNLPNKIRAREMMRRGEWPQEGCQYCEKIEAAGGTSDRQYQLLNHHDFDRTPQELIQDPSLNEVVPTILEIYFNNTCNMACLYCGEWFSSKWGEENKRFGVFDNGNGVAFGWDRKQPDLNYDKMLADFWQYLHDKDRYKHIRQYQIAGGEPFFQPELEMSLDFWDAHPNPELTFNFITNLKVPHKKFVSTIDRIGRMVNEGKLKRMQISDSMDGWGPQQEYVRWGLDLREFTENFEYLLDKNWIVKCINAAINPLSLKTMDQLVRKFNEWNDRCEPGYPISFSFMTVMAPNWMDPAIMGAGVFEEDFERILAEMREDNKSDQNAKEHMIGIAKQIAATPRNHVLVQGLKDYLTEIDRRRGTNWQNLFPWLVDVV
jgi:pyruvate-formate lyase-activating enzyme